MHHSVEGGLTEDQPEERLCQNHHNLPREPGAVHHIHTLMVSENGAMVQDFWGVWTWALDRQQCPWLTTEQNRNSREPSWTQFWTEFEVSEVSKWKCQVDPRDSKSVTVFPEDLLALRTVLGHQRLKLKRQCLQLICVGIYFSNLVLEKYYQIILGSYITLLLSSGVEGGRYTIKRTIDPGVWGMIH